MSSFDNNNQKLQQVLQLFLLPDYNIVTNTYLDLLLSHVAGEIKNSKFMKKFYFIFLMEKLNFRANSLS